MSKPRPTTNLEYRPRPSRWKTDLDRQDELITIVVMWTLVIVGLIALIVELTGTADFIRSFII